MKLLDGAKDSFTLSLSYRLFALISVDSLVVLIGKIRAFAETKLEHSKSRLIVQNVGNEERSTVS